MCGGGGGEEWALCYTHMRLWRLAVIAKITHHSLLIVCAALFWSWRRRGFDRAALPFQSSGEDESKYSILLENMQPAVTSDYFHFRAALRAISQASLLKNPLLIDSSDPQQT